MHPILRHGKLGLYLLVWGPVSAVLALLLSVHWQWRAAVGMSVPLCLVYAFVCLSAWYPCRSNPLRASLLLRSFAIHVAYAVAASAMWTGLAAGLAWLVDLRQALRPALLNVFGLGVTLYLLAVAVHYTLLAVESSRQAQAKEIEARALAGEAELKALKAQINPHFLFNSLHSISALTTIDPSRAREMCVLLSGFLRHTLGLGDKAAIPLEEELALARSYLEIEKVRFGVRLRVEEMIGPETASYGIPPLLLQPLVENAVVHGIAHLIEPGVIRIECTGDLLAGVDIIIENSFDSDAPASPRKGIGMDNVRRRLAARFQGLAEFRQFTRDGMYRIEIHLPGEKDLRS